MWTSPELNIHNLHVIRPEMAELLSVLELKADKVIVERIKNIWIFPNKVEFGLLTISLVVT